MGAPETARSPVWGWAGGSPCTPPACPVHWVCWHRVLQRHQPQKNTLEPHGRGDGDPCSCAPRLSHPHRGPWLSPSMQMTKGVQWGGGWVPLPPSTCFPCRWRHGTARRRTGPARGTTCRVTPSTCSRSGAGSAPPAAPGAPGAPPFSTPPPRQVSSAPSDAQQGPGPNSGCWASQG